MSRFWEGQGWGLQAAFLAASFLLAGAAGFAGEPHEYRLSGDFWGTHDPSVAKEGKTWYVFATGKAPAGGQFAIRCSQDLEQWQLCGQVFDRIPEWIAKDSPGTKDLWAPDIAYYKGEYRLYYAYSLFGKNTSGIALATNKTLDRNSPDYKWVDRGLVLRSAATDDFNAIDPNFVVDRKGRSWVAFGSFWTGIKLRRLDSQGKVSMQDARIYSLATRWKPGDAAPANPGLPADWEAIEAPFIVPHGGYYYLFVSWDMCCRGSRSTYRTMVGRSTAITGPYVDETGKPMIQGGGTEILHGNSSWVGPGGESVLSRSGQDIMVFHAYDGKTGKPALQVSTLDWSGGWPHAALGNEHEPAPENIRHGPQAQDTTVPALRARSPLNQKKGGSHVVSQDPPPFVSSVLRRLP
jgi:arabinan endo-1,5-alpha-L-arabinosidase